MCACLVAAGQAEGRAVRTVEGLAAGARSCDPVQQAFVDAGAVQCGFCTPGLIVAAHDLLARRPHPEDAEIREALAGNLCRCTGYEQIIEAVRLAATPSAGRPTVDHHGRDPGRRTSPPSTPAGTEHPHGHVVIDGAPDRRGRPGPADRRTLRAGAQLRRHHRLPGHPGAGEHPPPPVPVG